MPNELRKYTSVKDEDLTPLIRVLTNNGKRVEVHKAKGFIEGRFDYFYEVFILGDTEEE